MYSTEEFLSTAHTTFVTEGPLAILTFNRPEARNAMTWEMYRALVDACDRVDRDQAVRVFILRGAGGKAFVSGTDIAQFESFRGRDDGFRYEQRLDEVLDRLERVAKPTLAQVQGVAVGDRKSTRLNSSHLVISYAVFCLKKKNRNRSAGDHRPPPSSSGPPGGRRLLSGAPEGMVDSGCRWAVCHPQAVATGGLVTEAPPS